MLIVIDYPGQVKKLSTMGKGFGNLYYIRNIVYYKVSSYEQKAFPNFWRDTLRNTFNEIRTHGPFIVPPMAFAYLAVKWAEAERMRLVRKDPSLYKDDDDDE